MPTNLRKGDKKKALNAYKDKLLTEIFNYDKRIIAEAPKQIESSSFEEYESSDSDSELSLLMDSGPPISQLNRQNTMLKTFRHATQELIELEVLQSEVNVLVQSPVIEGESPIMQPGTWREVSAECCVDHVPFSITFYAHHGEGTFGPVSYRGLKVLVTKAAHEAELVKSVLPALRRPSDAVEVVRSYAVAHRSRRCTLAKLADKFGAVLFMEPMASGGYLLKCANLLEASWTLQNKRSPLAPFYHQLKFDLDYMDESYVKIIKRTHDQLSEPAVDTDKRTLLLAKIISTCLAALPLQPDTSDQDAGDMDSPVKDSRERVEKRRTTLDMDPDAPDMMKKKDSEVMAPPKFFAKVKPKNKTADPKPTKRSIQENESNDNVKKPKIDNNKEEYANTEVNKMIELTTKNSMSAASEKNNVCSGTAEKNKDEEMTSNTKSDRDKANVNNNKYFLTSRPNTENAKKAGKAKIANKKPANTDKPDENSDKKDEKEAAKNIGAAKNDSSKNVVKSAPMKRKSMTNIKANTKKPENSKTSQRSAPSTNKKVISAKNNFVKNDETNSKTVKTANSANAKETDNNEKPVSNKVTDRNVLKIVKNVTNEKGEIVKKVVKKLASDKPKVVERVSVANEPKANLPKQNITNKGESSEITKKANANTDKKKPLNEQNTKMIKISNQNTGKRMPPKVSIFTANPASIKKTSIGRIEKENTVQNKTTTSKIPQKKIVTTKSTIKKMPVRVSPRKNITQTKPPLAGGNFKKIVQKPVTGIPRLLTKTKPNVM